MAVTTDAFLIVIAIIIVQFALLNNKIPLWKIVGVLGMLSISLALMVLEDSMETATSIILVTLTIILAFKGILEIVQNYTSKSK